MEKNVLIATALSSHARIYLFNAKQMVEKARVIHDLWPTSCAGLGRSLAITALMGIMQKEEGESVTVRINGGGKMGTILCVGDSSGHVKGFCDNPKIYEKYPASSKLAVGKAVGTDGYLEVAKNLKLKQNYTSKVQLQSGEIGDDFAYYFLISQQIPTIVSVGVLVDRDCSVKTSGAMIIELLPGYMEEDIQYLENLSLRPISSVFEKNPSLYDYLYELFPDAEILEERFIEYHCDCSRERFLKSLLTLPKKDLTELSEEESISIKCEFCNTNYVFKRIDIQELLNDENKRS